MYYGIKTPFTTIKKYTDIKGLSISFTNKDVCSSLAKVRQNIEVLLSTKRGTRFMEPNIGSNLEIFLFEPNDFILEDSIRIAITECITNYLKDVVVDNVEIYSDRDGLRLKVQVKYTVISLGVTDELTLYKERPLME